MSSDNIKTARLKALQKAKTFLEKVDQVIRKLNIDADEYLGPCIIRRYLSHWDERVKPYLDAKEIPYTVVDERTQLQWLEEDLDYYLKSFPREKSIEVLEDTLLEQAMAVISAIEIFVTDARKCSSS